MMNFPYSKTGQTAPIGYPAVPLTPTGTPVGMIPSVGAPGAPGAISPPFPTGVPGALPGALTPPFPAGAPGALPGALTPPFPAGVPSPFPAGIPGTQPVTPPPLPSGAPIPGQPGAVTEGVTLPGQLPIEQSYIENILRLNLGKIGTFYMTYENNSQWNAKIFKGRIEAAGRDHIIISDPQTGMRILLLMVNLDYVTFDEPLNYFYPVTGAAAGVPTGR